MRRRNFIGNLVVVGAGFFILPQAKLNKRIWVPDRTVVKATAGSIWKDYYITPGVTYPDQPLMPSQFGQVEKHAGNLWFRSHTGWHMLHKYGRPLNWMDSKTPRLMSNTEIQAVGFETQITRQTYHEPGDPYETVQLQEAMKDASQPAAIPEIKEIHWNGMVF